MRKKGIHLLPRRTMSERQRTRKMPLILIVPLIIFLGGLSAFFLNFPQYVPAGLQLQIEALIIYILVLLILDKKGYRIHEPLLGSQMQRIRLWFALVVLFAPITILIDQMLSYWTWRVFIAVLNSVTLSVGFILLNYKKLLKTIEFTKEMYLALMMGLLASHFIVSSDLSSIVMFKPFELSLIVGTSVVPILSLATLFKLRWKEKKSQDSLESE